MQPYRIIALDAAYTEQVREHHQDPIYQHPAPTSVATGYGPCRQCLRTFEVGKDTRMLVTYDAFRNTEKLPLPGPIFIHAESCDTYDPEAGFPDDLREHDHTFTAYGQGRKLVAVRYTTGDTGEAAVQELLAMPEVDYIQVRDTVAGCYDFTITRA